MKPKPIGVRWQQFIEYRMPDGKIEGHSCAPWIPPLCARIAIVLQEMHQRWLAVRYEARRIRGRIRKALWALETRWTKTP